MISKVSCFGAVHLIKMAWAPTLNQLHNSSPNPNRVASNNPHHPPLIPYSTAPNSSHTLSCHITLYVTITTADFSTLEFSHPFPPPAVIKFCPLPSPLPFSTRPAAALVDWSSARPSH